MKQICSDSKSINMPVHLASINSATHELLRFTPRTIAPASIPHQYIGTIVDNTVALLTAPANSLTDKPVAIRFSEESNWISLMQAVHRSFFSSIMSAVESGLTHIARTYQIPTVSKQGQKMLSKMAAIQKTCADAGLNVPELNSLADHFSSYKPNFADHLESVLQATAIDNKSKKRWRATFRALSIVRNKASHSDTTLTAVERDDLRTGGYEMMIDAQGGLALNPSLYARVTRSMLDFFDEVELGLQR